MSHEIEKNNAFFVGQAAWHGLGTVLEKPPTVEEGIKIAGLDWGVKLEPLYVKGPELEPGKENLLLVSHKATVRESDNSILGVVGPDYRPLQNKDAFAWFQPFIDAKTAFLEAAGSLRMGKRVWVLAKVAEGGECEIVKGDPISQYILLAHAHDGSLAIRVGFTTVRVVCANTLSAAVNDKSEATKLLKVRHTSRAKEALDEVRAIMDVARKEFAATRLQLEFLASVGCDELALTRYVREVFSPGKADEEDASPRMVQQIVPLFEGGVGSHLSRGTWWGAFNALTQFVTHHQGKSADTRLDNQWFGPGAQVLQRGLQVAVDMANEGNAKTASVQVPNDFEEREDSGEIQSTGEALPTGEIDPVSEVANTEIEDERETLFDEADQGEGDDVSEPEESDVEPDEDGDVDEGGDE